MDNRQRQNPYSLPNYLQSNLEPQNNFLPYDLLSGIYLSNLGTISPENPQGNNIFSVKRINSNTSSVGLKRFRNE